jgi:hypothetical protein
MAEAPKNAVANGASPPPKKRSLFQKPAWAKPVAQKEGIEFFSRAEELWPSRLAEEERKRQKKATKIQRQRPTASPERKAPSTSDAKRRRVSLDRDHERASSEGSLNHDDPEESSWRRRQEKPGGHGNHSSLTALRESTLSTPGSRKSNSSSRRNQQASPASEQFGRVLHSKDKEVSKNEMTGKHYILLSDSDEKDGKSPRAINNVMGRSINLDDNDDDDDILEITSKPVAQIEDDPNISDEEFPELVRLARQREKQKELERLTAGNSFKDKSHDPNGSSIPAQTNDDIFEERSTISEDPVVEILVSSWIEGTKPLVVRRKLSQKLKEVRLIWCDKQTISGQPFTKAVKDSIFLTWRGKRVFDLTSCKSLGLKIHGNGQLFSDGEGFMEGKVHFEAWTADLFELHQRKLAAKQGSDADEQQEEQVEKAIEQKIRLVMTAKGMEVVKLCVKPTTVIGKMAGAFRDQRKIPIGKEIVLYFDGDKIDPESTVEEAELADMDNVEVHIR